MMLKIRKYVTPRSRMAALDIGVSLLNTASNEGYEVIETDPFSTRHMNYYDPSYLEDFDEEK